MTDKGPWRVGILFSTSGVTSIIEKSQLKGVMLAIDEINELGGVRGRPIEAVCYNPGSHVSRYGELAEKLILEDRINVIFGCYMSSSRKEILPIVERRNALLFYPTLYEGFEYSPNVMYGGATPNQNSVPLGNHLMESYGRRIYFVGSDYVYPRESNRVMRHVIRQGGGEVLGEEYLPLRNTSAMMKDVIDRIMECKPDAIFSTVVGQGCINFYRAYHLAGGSGLVCPIASLTTNEAEIEEIGVEASEGHITAAPYFRNLSSVSNRRFLASYHAKYQSVSDVTSCGEAAYTQMHLFGLALEETGEMDAESLRASLLGSSFEAPQGAIRVDPDNNHTYLHALIARVNEKGEFVIAHKVRQTIKPDPYLVYPAVNDWKFRTQKVESS